MQIVSTQDFATDVNRYFDLAIDGQVAVRRGDYMFNIVCNFEPPQKVLQPDDDFRRAITIDELLVGIHEDIRRKYASRK